MNEHNIFLKDLEEKYVNYFSEMFNRYKLLDHLKSLKRVMNLKKYLKLVITSTKSAV